MNKKQRSKEARKKKQKKVGIFPAFFVCPKKLKSYIDRKEVT